MARRESEDIREMVAAVLRCIPPTPEAAQGPVYVAARRGGIKLWETWGERVPWETGLRATLQDPPPPRRGDDAPDAFEVCLTQLPQPVDPRRRPAALSNAHRGVKGMQVAHGGLVVRFAPTEMIARNLSFQRVLQL